MGLSAVCQRTGCYGTLQFWYHSYIVTQGISEQYADICNNPTYDGFYNPNGSVEAIEGITSPDGRILGKMGHSERVGKSVIKNIPGSKDQKLFEAGVNYFKL